MSDHNRRWGTRYHLLGYVLVFLVVLATASTAQVPGLFPTPTPTPRPPTPQPQPTATPTPTTTPAPTSSPTPAPIPSEVPLPTETEDPEGTAEEEATPEPGPGEEGFSDLPPGLEAPPIEIPVIARTRPRNTSNLVRLLEPLTEYGLPLDQVLVEGMGRFPVAGPAYYYDDWLNPRFTPTFHLHKGLDIFADFGTPIRAPDAGVVTRFSDNPSGGGVGIWTRGEDGTAYYFAHLLERAEGLQVGQRVEVGTVIGYVGDTGNARGGPPHLHMEIHRGGPIPPKPTVDRWLDEAEELAPRWVAARRAEIEAKRRLLGGEAETEGARTTRADLEASMLLTLLDPVGGSVGLLPRLELAPRQRSGVSDGLLLELIRLRLDGFLFVPSAHGLHGHD